MVEIKLTPGSWRAEEWSCHAKTTVLTDDPLHFSGKREIADCQTEEDARAIAALPDLIEAALAAERLLTRAGWRADNTFDPEAVTLAKLRAAIAKAAGA
jgi:hypothetical protein